MLLYNKEVGVGEADRGCASPEGGRMAAAERCAAAFWAGLTISAIPCFDRRAQRGGPPSAGVK